MYGIILSVVKSLPTRMKGRLYLIEEVILKNGSILELLRQKDDKVVIHNIDNDRMIVTNNAVFGKTQLIQIIHYLIYLIF